MEDKTITRQQTPSISLRDLLTIVFKHKYKIVSIFLVSVIGATIIAFSQCCGMRRCSVSSPSRNRNAANGLMHPPMSRSRFVRHFIM